MGKYTPDNPPPGEFDLPAISLREGADVRVVALLVARAAAEAADRASVSFPVENDTGGGRGGVVPEGPDLMTIAAVLRDNGSLSAGVRPTGTCTYSSPLAPAAPGCWARSACR